MINADLYYKIWKDEERRRFAKLEDRSRRPAVRRDEDRRGESK